MVKRTQSHRIKFQEPGVCRARGETPLVLGNSSVKAGLSNKNIKKHVWLANLFKMVGKLINKMLFVGKM